jgi:hypothetical protein
MSKILLIVIIILAVAAGVSAVLAIAPPRPAVGLAGATPRPGAVLILVISPGLAGQHNASRLGALHVVGEGVALHVAAFRTWYSAAQMVPALQVVLLFLAATVLLTILFLLASTCLLLVPLLRCGIVKVLYGIRAHLRTGVVVLVLALILAVIADIRVAWTTHVSRVSRAVALHVGAAVIARHASLLLRFVVLLAG